MTVCIIGLGLMGGSMALALQKNNLSTFIVGVDNNENNALIAIKLGLVNHVDTLANAIQKADVIIIAIPVDSTVNVLPFILDNVKKNTVVLDMGSTKEAICSAIASHKNRHQFVATHPMWGTENSGPMAAEKNAFGGKAVIICEHEKSSEAALKTTQNIYTAIGMHLIYMQPNAHDVHTAYISHISHITSFALANTVLEKEKEDDAIFELASAGFESTVRLAKSDANMWVPIFMQNRENVLDVLNEHIAQLKKFKSCLEKENVPYLFELINKANGIKQVLAKKA